QSVTWEGARGARRELAGALGGDDRGAPIGAGGGVVTEAEVWSALADVEDPEIPVISVVDLGVVRGVHVEGERVHVEFTPTFLGCPALEMMRAQMAAAIRRSRSCSTTPGRPTGSRPLVGRSCALRASRPRRPGRRLHRASSSCRARPSAAPTAARPTPGWRTSSAPHRAGRSATARAAGSRSSSSRRSNRGPHRGVPFPRRADSDLGSGLPTIGGDMYAVVVKVTVNDREAAEKRLREAVVPRVSQLPGVIAGYWTRGESQDGLSMVVFESEDAARAAADQVPQMVDESVSLGGVEVREVVANV